MSILSIISQKNKSAKDSLIHWKSENPKAYADFIRQIEQAKHGDYAAYTIMQTGFASNCSNVMRFILLVCF